jgi:uncharacterized glyoxalase superfamily protein PhnB
MESGGVSISGSTVRRAASMPITPYLYYEDLGTAMKFLEKAFGFRRFGARSRGPDGRINHAAMKAGSNVVLMGRPPTGYRNPRHLGQATQCLLINVRNVDRHYERAVKAGARVLQEPADTPFGTRRYGVADPEGHEWYFSQARRKRRP